jgi:hypothetical protein
VQRAKQLRTACQHLTRLSYGAPQVAEQEQQERKKVEQLSPLYQQILKNIPIMPDSAVIPVPVAALHEGVSRRTIKRTYPRVKMSECREGVLLGYLRRKREAAWPDAADLTIACRSVGTDGCMSELNSFPMKSIAVKGLPSSRFFEQQDARMFSSRQLYGSLRGP